MLITIKAASMTPLFDAALVVSFYLLSIKFRLHTIVSYPCFIFFRLSPS